MCLDYQDACEDIVVRGCKAFPDTLNDSVCVYKPVLCEPLTWTEGNVTYEGMVNNTLTKSTTAHFHCHPLYELGLANLTMQCTWSGSWRPRRLPSCFRRTLCNVTTVANGDVSYNPDMLVVEGQGYVTVQGQARTTCSEGYTLHGVANAVCLKNGRWSHEFPRCIKTAARSPVLLASLLTVGLLLVVGTTVSLFVVRRKILRKKDKFASKKDNFLVFNPTIDFAGKPKKESKASLKTLEKKHFDLFLIYSSSDYRQVRDSISLPFEERSPYSLCIADRDFFAGRLIVENIQHAITTSRGVLLALSQNFLESEWCKYEFFQAYQQAIEDRHFHLVIVLLQPFTALRDVPPVFKQYYKKYTCIYVEEENFQDKLTRAVHEQLKSPVSELKTLAQPQQSSASKVVCGKREEQLQTKSSTPMSLLKRLQGIRLCGSHREQTTV